MTSPDRRLLSTDHLADVVIDIATVLTARPAASDADRAAMRRLRDHPAVRRLAGARRLHRATPRRARPGGLDEFGDPDGDEGEAV